MDDTKVRAQKLLEHLTTELHVPKPNHGQRLRCTVRNCRDLWNLGIFGKEVTLTCILLRSFRSSVGSWQNFGVRLRFAYTLHIQSAWLTMSVEKSPGVGVSDTADMQMSDAHCSSARCSSSSLPLSASSRVLRVRSPVGIRSSDKCENM